jgi:hypothetical protein
MPVEIAPGDRCARVFDVDLAKSFHGDYLGCSVDDPLSNLIRFYERNAA